ncbi:hypothetical protein GVAV_003576 [Gurleya vavrai]
MITDLQPVEIHEIGYEEDYYFMIKNLQCADVKANLCILPCFEDIRDDSFEVKKEKLVKSIDNLINNVSIELNCYPSEPKKMQSCKPINSQEIKFIKENGWLINFFNYQIIINKIFDFINELSYDDYTILSNKKSNIDVKKKLIYDWICENKLTINLNEQLNLNETNTEISNIITNFESKFKSLNYEENFIKVILHIFEQNQENFKFSNFEFPRAVKIMDFYYDEKMKHYVCTEIWNVFYEKKIKNILR